VTKLRRDLEEAHIQQEATLISLKKKHQDAISEMTEQIEQLSKMKAKVEKDKTHIIHEIADARAAVDEVGRSKASADKSHRNLLTTLNEQAKKIEEANLTLSDVEQGKKKTSAENADLLRQLQEMDNSANMLAKLKLNLADQLAEARSVADNESKERQLLLGKFRNAEHEVSGMKDHYEEEAGSKENLARQLNKALGEADLLRVRYEKEGVAKAEELEMAKLKMQARLSEAESTSVQLQSKLGQIEKARSKLTSDLEAQAQALDQAQILNNAMEKKAKQFDRIVGEWKQKVDSVGMDLDNAQKETRNASSDLFRVKSAYEEAVLQLDEVRRENKTLSNEIKDIMDQISEGGRSIHEIDKICKRLDAEKMELEAALSEAEGALEQEENKVLRAQLELTQVRQEIERKIAEKEEEFASTKKNMGKALENMQAAVETEAKGKAEALRMKKKLEGDVLDLDCSLEHANAANAETQRTIKTYQLSLREAQSKLESEQVAKEHAHDALISADRKCNSNQNALEEARTLLEQADRSRRMVEQELADTNESLSDQTCSNQAIQGSKMKMESEMSTLSGDLDEMVSEAGMSEEKAQRAMIDAARLADELRGEQDMAQGLERERKLLEAQVKDMQTRVDDAQSQAMKGGKKAMTKMDTRIRELESEMDAENRRMGDAQKNMRKSERRIKELTYQQDEDRKNHERMQGMIDQLQGKIKSYKKQIEEAEEIAALNLAKYRQAQNNVSDASERASGSEQALAKNRARGRSASIGPVSFIIGFPSTFFSHH
jgi:myosin heavy chain 6/7